MSRGMNMKRETFDRQREELLALVVNRDLNDEEWAKALDELCKRHERELDEEE